jgi:excisionase family DNA binding protein
MTGAETFIDVGRVAEILGLSTATIRKWVLTRYIPYIKIGSAVRFSAQEVQEWARSKRIGAMPPQAKELEGGGQ